MATWCLGPTEPPSTGWTTRPGTTYTQPAIQQGEPAMSEDSTQVAEKKPRVYYRQG